MTCIKTELWLTVIFVVTVFCISACTNNSIAEIPNNEMSDNTEKLNGTTEMSNNTKTQNKTAEIFDNPEMPDDFNIKIKFGVGTKNCIDTYNNTFTKDLIIDGTETIEFVIPADKMREIYEVFKEYKIYELPYDINAQEFIGDENSFTATHAKKYIITYICNNRTKTAICDDKGPWDALEGFPDTRDRLVNFVDIICDYIYSTEEYQNMSPSTGGYE